MERYHYLMRAYPKSFAPFETLFQALTAACAAAGVPAPLPLVDSKFFSQSEYVLSSRFLAESSLKDLFADYLDTCMSALPAVQRVLARQGSGTATDVFALLERHGWNEEAAAQVGLDPVLTARRSAHFDKNPRVQQGPAHPLSPG